MAGTARDPSVRHFERRLRSARMSVALTRDPGPEVPPGPGTARVDPVGRPRGVIRDDPLRSFLQAATTVELSNPTTPRAREALTNFINRWGTLGVGLNWDPDRADGWKPSNDLFDSVWAVRAARGDLQHHIRWISAIQRRRWDDPAVPSMERARRIAEDPHWQEDVLGWLPASSDTRVRTTIATPDYRSCHRTSRKLGRRRRVSRDQPRRV